MAQVSNYLAGVNMAVSVPPVRMLGPRGVDTVNYAGVSLYDRKREMEEDESKRPVTKRRRIRRRRRKQQQQQQQQPTAQQESSRRRRPLLPVRRYEIPKRVVVKYPEHIVREVRLSVLSADKIQRLSQWSNLRPTHGARHPAEHVCTVWALQVPRSLWQDRAEFAILSSALH